MAKPSKTTVQEEFMAAYEEFADAIFRFCILKVSNREQALDIMQDTFTKTWEYASAGNKIENWKAFLYRAANNLVIDYYRKKKTSSLDEMEETVGFIPTADTMSAEKEADVIRAHRKILALPEEYRSCVQLRFVDGLQPQEIADVLGLSVNVVSVRIHRGMEKLRVLMGAHE